MYINYTHEICTRKMEFKVSTNQETEGILDRNVMHLAKQVTKYQYSVPITHIDNVSCTWYSYNVCSIL